MAEDKKSDNYTIEMDKLDQGNSRTFEAPPPPQPRAAPANNPILPVLAYCGSSILMTVMNKYVLSGTNFNLNFFLLCVQVCVKGIMEWCALSIWMCTVNSLSSPLYVFLRFRGVRPLVLLTTVISTVTRRGSVCIPH